ncbi:hypothetical protein A9B99_12105 [Mangrovibacter phragmitis]|uniref:Uncharacterized protein n=1 Tax=Mangrovibacter phragmitis TaxID=1691903 RepID=A0A1B7L1L3_9ENTR|nr:hypothetical protein [Mangrovibacter phragmitis]OAT76181.1 hypothetical protein A9B99_12105 [Mangrovibacter phragmitis]
MLKPEYSRNMRLTRPQVIQPCDVLVDAQRISAALAVTPGCQFSVPGLISGTPALISSGAMFTAVEQHITARGREPLVSDSLHPERG